MCEGQCKGNFMHNWMGQEQNLCERCIIEGIASVFHIFFQTKSEKWSFLKLLITSLNASKIFDSDLSRLAYFPDTPLHFSSGGVRGVALVHSPLLGTKGRVSMDMMHATDWVPTLYGLAGGNTTKLKNLDGFDMWPTLSHGEQNPRSEILINIDGNNAALRFQQWKLINTSN